MATQYRLVAKETAVYDERTNYTGVMQDIPGATYRVADTDVIGDVHVSIIFDYTPLLGKHIVDAPSSLFCYFNLNKFSGKTEDIDGLSISDAEHDSVIGVKYLDLAPTPLFTTNDPVITEGSSWTEIVFSSTLTTFDVCRNVTILDLPWMTYTDTLDFYGAKSSKSPYLLVTAEDGVDVVAFLSSTVPAVIDPNTPVYFYAGAIPGVLSFPTDPLQVYRVSYKFWEQGQSEADAFVLVSETGGSIYAPAGTFSHLKNYNWTATLETSEGTIDVADVKSFSTTDASPTVTIVRPKNVYIDKSAAVEMEWTYTVTTGLKQKAIDVQYRTTGAPDTWITLVDHLVTSETKHTIPGGVLPSGSVFLRARGYNANDLPGEWSADVGITVVGPPDAPQVFVSEASPRPVVQWATEGQAGFEVRAGEYSSGIVAGVQQQFKVPEFLPDGETEIMVRVSNSMGLWSEWGRTSILVENDPLPDPKLQANVTPNGYSVELKWRSAAPKAYIFKDGALIAKTEQNRWVDQMASGPAVYEIMVADGDFYGRSEPVYASVVVPCPLLAGETSEWFEVSARLNAAPEVGVSDTVPVSFMQYAGRKYPVAELGDGVTRAIAFECVFKAGDPRIERVGALLGQSVRYKDDSGLCLRGVMESCEWVRNRRFAVASCSIVQVAAAEEVSYDV